jgi:HIRAN domain-containing protein
MMLALYLFLAGLLVLFIVAFADTRGLTSGWRNARSRIVRPRQSQRPLPQSHSGRIFRSAVAGESFRNDDGSSRQEILRRCRIGEEILLVPEPDSPHDSVAVKVQRRNGEQIGYLPRDHHLAGEIGDGRVSAVLDHATGGGPGKPMRGAVLQILVERG